MGATSGMRPRSLNGETVNTHPSDPSIGLIRLQTRQPFPPLLRAGVRAGVTP